MKTIFILTLIILPFSSYADYINQINPHKNWGVWEGWGTSLAWWANAFGDRDDLADLMFTTKNVKYNNQTVPGLGLNIARYNVGGCSWNTVGKDKMSVSPKIPKFKQIEGFWLNWESDDPKSKSWDWNVDKKQRLMVDKAIARGVNIVEMFSNSPMWWMLYNHNPSGAANGGDNLQEWNYQKFAIYLATVAKHAADNWNVTFASVEPFNEASSLWWNSGGAQEGCHIGSGAQQKVIEYLRAELDKRGLKKTIISASDENTYNDAITMWNSFSTSVRSKVSRVNVHGYSYAFGKRDELYSLVHKEGKGLWNSEYGEGDASGLPLAENLCLDLFWLHPTAWVYWQPFDIPGWGMIQSHPDKQYLGPVSPKYYVMAQYSRHIRKGMQIIETKHTDSVVAYDHSNHRLVVVILNRDKSQNITLDLSLFTRISDGSVKRWTTETVSGDRYVLTNDLHIKAKKITIPLTKKSVQTIEVNNVFI